LDNAQYGISAALLAYTWDSMNVNRHKIYLNEGAKLRSTREKCFGNANHSRLAESNAAFTLIEVVIAVGVLAVMVVALYASFALGFAQIQTSRESVRATQIITHKMEMIRLLNWDQVISAGYVPSSFTSSFYSDDPASNSLSGIIYNGTVQLTTPSMSETYASNMRQIKVRVTWTSNGIGHQKEMTTFVTQYGMQKYIY
jgi:uncharacterized protein (TIGR02598 family)